MFDINYCSIILPDFDENIEFNGVYSISDRLYAWIYYDKSEEQCLNLFDFLHTHEKFNILLQTDYYAITGFDCFRLTPFIRTITQTCDNVAPILTYEPQEEKELIKIECSLWIEGCIESSIDFPRWRSLKLDIPYTEYWFDRETTSFFINFTSENINAKICFYNGTYQSWKFYQKSYAKKQKCNITLDFENAISTQKAMDIALIIQVLIRYMSDISYPITEIKVSEKTSAPPIPSITIKGKLGLKGISDRPLEIKYANIPLFLSNLNEHNLDKWINAWKHISTAIITFELAREKPLNTQIIDYVKVFDTLSSHFEAQKFSEQTKKVFADWKKEVLNYINTNNPLKFSQSRINGLLNNLKRSDLSSRMKSFLIANEKQIKEIKQTDDIPKITKYLKGMRTADAHPSDFDIYNLPDKYHIGDIRDIAKQMVQILINKEIFEI